MHIKHFLRNAMLYKKIWKKNLRFVIVFSRCAWVPIYVVEFELFIRIKVHA